jgi:hypothetical protein
VKARHCATTICTWPPHGSTRSQTLLACLTISKCPDTARITLWNLQTRRMTRDARPGLAEAVAEPHHIGFIGLSYKSKAESWTLLDDLTPVRTWQ